MFFVPSPRATRAQQCALSSHLLCSLAHAHLGVRLLRYAATLRRGEKKNGKREPVQREFLYARSDFYRRSGLKHVCVVPPPPPPPPLAFFFSAHRVAYAYRKRGEACTPLELLFLAISRVLPAVRHPSKNVNCRRFLSSSVRFYYGGILFLLLAHEPVIENEKQRNKTRERERERDETQWCDFSGDGHRRSA